MVRVRDAVVAGMFYPKYRKELLQMLEILDNEASRYALKLNKPIKALIVPHAGYAYSGIVAASGYKTLLQNQKDIKHFTLIGPSHYFGFYDIAGSTYEAWRTPLGLVPVKNLIELPPFDNAFAHEHSLEVQLPFLQYYFEEFSIFPILTGKITDIKSITQLFDKTIENTTFIISSDLSHYYPYDVAKKIDANTIEKIMSLDYKGFVEEGDACGKESIKILLALAIEHKWEPHLILYQNSGDTSENKENVVGYVSIAFTEG